MAQFVDDDDMNPADTGESAEGRDDESTMPSPVQRHFDGGDNQDMSRRMHEQINGKLSR